VVDDDEAVGSLPNVPGRRVGTRDDASLHVRSRLQNPGGPWSCAAGEPALDAHLDGIEGAVNDTTRQACFNQTIQTKHLTLPAGTTADQAYDNYKACLKNKAPVGVLIGPFIINGNKQDTARHDCFELALARGAAAPTP
jgi:hypothetical protein